MKRSRRTPATAPPLAELDLAALTDPVARRLLQQALNLVEELAQTVATLRSAAAPTS